MKKTTWSSQENEAIDRNFKDHIRYGTAVRKEEAMAAKLAEPILENRTWKAIKWHVKNRATTYKRNFFRT